MNQLTQPTNQIKESIDEYIKKADARARKFRVYEALQAGCGIFIGALAVQSAIKGELDETMLSGAVAGFNLGASRIHSGNAHNQEVLSAQLQASAIIESAQTQLPPPTVK